MNGYSDIIRKWATDDSHTGVLSNPDGIGEVGLEAGEAGRKLAVRFTLRRSGDRIKQVRYQVFGCGFTIAACAAAARLAEGKPLNEARMIDARAIDLTLDGLPTERDYCADIAAKALRAAVDSADKDGAVVQSAHQEEEHGSRISGDETVYRLLMESPNSNNTPEEDRRLFAGVITLAASEPHDLTHALGLNKTQMEKILNRYFPQVYLDNLLFLSAHATTLPPEINSDVHNIICLHIPEDNETADWLANILATRAAHPGHLWVAMGFFARPELTAAIKRHLPSLAAANNMNMRWKRYLFKQACDLNGGVMCKSPNCGDCSEHALCFEAI